MAPLSDALPVVGRSAGGVGLLLFFDAVHGENRPDVRQHPVNIPRGAAQRGTTTVSHNNENMAFCVQLSCRYVCPEPVSVNDRI